MPTLSDALRGRDFGFLRMVAAAWGIELTAPDVATALPQLVRGILQAPWREEVLSALPSEAQMALQAVLEHEGRMSWALFTRRFGTVRQLGPARREKERPDLHPASPAEVLWYRALIGRAFLNSPEDPEPLEYAYIPDDLLEVIRPLASTREAPPGRPATPLECAHPILTGDWILDHATTLLAALRMGLSLENLSNRNWPISPSILAQLLNAAGLIDENGLPRADATRAFLEAPRAEALAHLTRSWMESPLFNELRLLPGLKFEGDWQNDPLRARRAILDWLNRVPDPGNGWWNLSSLVRTIQEQDPDFQRPAGDYDSWFIRHETSGEYLRGFEHWDEVDGALVRFIITGPLHWLGILDLASPAPDAPPAAFRFTSWAEALLQGKAPKGLPEETERVRLTSSGQITVPRLAPRTLRYQLARFCLWGEEKSGEYRYRVAPEGLQRASAQGLHPRQFLALLRRYLEPQAIPPSLVQALERWETSGTQAAIESALILRVSSPAVLEVLRKSRASRFILEELSPTVVLLRPGSQEQVRNALQESGFLTDTHIEEARSRNLH
ncbi:MAG TPA: hypothetical protein DEQ80_10695 [Anaerolinea thermolimosa]|uniref:Helicase XPB/Ssl2 N-terminal domain-containing protein n=1 Tax=Anaerolinea thermolimosa TaxID=229919 RepID=A0A3D1JKY6_9CHLR|nr:hypothetical protein [Anaerolinea thermolimosa]GAP05324.1 protein containing helicase-conserved C-terminal domain [Anaerolinea thermolimosa]HCE18316.1 hypothetical protein [Anaerolinea thermolimosa]